MDAEPKQVIDRYLQGMRADTGQVSWTESSAPSSDRIRLHAIGIRNSDAPSSSSQVDIDQPISIEIDYEVLLPQTINAVQIQLKDDNGVYILSSANAPSMSLTQDESFGKPLAVGRYQTRCILPANFLNDSRYVISLFLGPEIGKPTIRCENVLAFSVLDTGAMRKEYLGSWYGPVIRPRLAWSTSGDNLLDHTTVNIG